MWCRAKKALKPAMFAWGKLDFPVFRVSYFPLLIVNFLAGSLAFAEAPREVEIGQICVLANSTDASEPVLKAGAEVIAEITALGHTGCVSGGEFSAPTIKNTGSHKWLVEGKFVRNPPGARTPDCGGATAEIFLGRLASGKYEVSTGKKSLKFQIPTNAKTVCLK